MQFVGALEGKHPNVSKATHHCLRVCGGGRVLELGAIYFTIVTSLRDDLIDISF